MPYRLNSSVTHQTHAQRNGCPEELSAMLMMLKQGIGGLIWREGVQSNRAIWLLDGRFYRDYNRYAGNVEQLFVRYRQSTDQVH